MDLIQLLGAGFVGALFSNLLLERLIRDREKRTWLRDKRFEVFSNLNTHTAQYFALFRRDTLNEHLKDREAGDRHMLEIGLKQISIYSQFELLITDESLLEQYKQIIAELIDMRKTALAKKVDSISEL